MTAADETALTFDDLLRHEAWLRSLARRLVGDQDADDVVQETFAAALANRAPIGNPAAWLGRVVHNLARLGRRRPRRVRGDGPRAAGPWRVPTLW